MKFPFMFFNYVRKSVIDFISKYVFCFVYILNSKRFFKIIITTTMFSEIFNLNNFYYNPDNVSFKTKK